MKRKFIMCPSCGERSFIDTKKDYDGFKVIAEKKVCALCGFEFKREKDIAYIEEGPIFGEDDSAECLCRNCSYYVVHPWTQKCTLRKIETTALDTCPHFLKKGKD